ncbi:MULTISPECIES: MarR family winged helix-turn-helix transcriptional regulator [Streptomyces]|uniref:MarR family winged helix-turn-helix transcriptional regulator n=1 Tax=Streptomyces TaxID=1883 RepID=UPI000F79E3F1|nr:MULTISPECIES: MarR family transcriptional regulator [Streptomyces]RSS99054.1 MarR family transcriptional regulator [Streptomyces sp. WAC07149]GLX24018.1 MarR family transcriptional regulator [Streptomyces lavendulae subsp. lavendulae]GLX31909.1 MarR family transcriptional regulator [Streptomyces lavendulae subsp. lavendulae]
MGEQTQGRVLSFLVRQTWLGMRAAIGAELAEFGLTVPQFATLMMVRASPGMSVAQLARSVGSTRQAANEMLTALQRDGLITRSPHPTDRRTHQLHVTELGSARYEEALPAVTRREAELEEGLPPGQREAALAWMSAVASACQEPVDGCDQ